MRAWNNEVTCQDEVGQTMIPLAQHDRQEQKWKKESESRKDRTKFSAALVEGMMATRSVPTPRCAEGVNIVPHHPL